MMCQRGRCRPLCVMFICVIVCALSNGRPKESADQVASAEPKPDSSTPTGQAVNIEAANQKQAVDGDTNDKPVIKMSIDSANPTGQSGEAQAGGTNQQQAEGDFAIKVDVNTDKGENKIGPENKIEPESTTQTTASSVINVHDARSRAMAEQLKHVPYQSGDIEEIMHGGHHVHGEEHEGAKQPIGVGGADMTELLDGKPKEEVTQPPSTADVEDLMHTGDASDHPHEAKAHDDKERKAPSADNPEDLLHMGDVEAHAENLKHKAPGADNPEESLHSQAGHHGAEKVAHDKDAGDKQKAGISVEKVVHGDDHTHDNEGGVMEEYVDENGNKQKRKLGKDVTIDDIKKLGLSDKDLEGVDLSKLLRRDKAEYNEWKKEQGDAGQQKEGGFWDTLDDFREHYFKMVAKQIRNLSPYRDHDDDGQEWEWDVNEEPHPGESQVEHESELWGSTRNKANRRRGGFTIIRNDPPHENADEL